MYNYDAADRLTQFKRGTLNEGKTDVATYTSDANLTQRQTWTLDDLGNWAVNELQQDSVSVAQAATANLADEYTAIDFDGPGGDDPVELAHDHNGNLKDDGTYLYDYDIENRMTRVRQKSGGATIAVYQYDALSRRIRKTITNLGSGTDGTFEFVNSPEWQVLELNRTAGSAAFDVVAYVHAGQSAYIDDHVAYAADTNPWTYYHTDAQYDTIATSDYTGSIALRFVTDPYGKATAYSSSWTSPEDIPVPVMFGHQGLVRDSEADKYQNRHREHIPSLGLFAQRDPLVYVDGANTHSYEHSRPLVGRDSHGEEFDGVVIWLRACASLNQFCREQAVHDCIFAIAGQAGGDCIRIHFYDCMNKIDAAGACTRYLGI